VWTVNNREADGGAETRLRLMVDYSAETPVWFNPGGNVLDLTGLGLQPLLVRRLIAWQRHFDQHYSLDRQPHWSGEEVREWHIEEGRRLREELARAIPSADVVLDLWSADDDLA
jgi:hypothetical protein